MQTDATAGVGWLIASVNRRRHSEPPVIGPCSTTPLETLSRMTLPWFHRKRTEQVSAKRNKLVHLLNGVCRGAAGRAVALDGWYTRRDVTMTMPHNGVTSRDNGRGQNCYWMAHVGSEFRNSPRQTHRLQATGKTRNWLTVNMKNNMFCEPQVFHS